MRVLILGGDGMLGHRLFLSLQQQFDVRCTLHRDFSAYMAYGIFPQSHVYTGIDARSSIALDKVLADFRPDAVINCIGIVKQRDAAHESIPSLEINALLPHRLAVLCRTAGARLVHISTDCVFSGSRGGYTEDDPSDATDLYGKTKYLGEVSSEGCITLRTSIIGRELDRRTSLLEWFLAQEGTVRGFRKVIYTGFTTHEVSRIIAMLLDKYPQASGLYHVSSEPTDKYSLLCLFRDTLGKNIEIIPDDELVCDRSLDSSRFRSEFSYQPPDWEAMVEELKTVSGG